MQQLVVEIAMIHSASRVKIHDTHRMPYAVRNGHDNERTTSY